MPFSPARIFWGVQQAEPSPAISRDPYGFFPSTIFPDFFGLSRLNKKD